MKRAIALVGFMGAGKSTIGEGLARRLGRRFVDLDEEIVARADESVAEIFENKGEKGFRRLEAETLAETIAGGDAPVIACGGGVVTTAAGRKALRQAIVVYLAVEENVLTGRLAGQTSRPLLAGYGEDKLAGRVHQLLAARRPLYARVADLAVDAGRPPAETIRRIERLLVGQGVERS